MEPSLYAPESPQASDPPTATDITSSPGCSFCVVRIQRPGPHCHTSYSPCQLAVSAGLVACRLLDRLLHTTFLIQADVHQRRSVPLAPHVPLPV